MPARPFGRPHLAGVPMRELSPWAGIAGLFGLLALAGCDATPAGVTRVSQYRVAVVGSVTESSGSGVEDADVTAELRAAEVSGDCADTVLASTAAESVGVGGFELVIGFSVATSPTEPRPEARSFCLSVAARPPADRPELDASSGSEITLEIEPAPEGSAIEDSVSIEVVLPAP